MKKLFFISVITLLLASCTPQKYLYSWESYEQSSYNYLKNNDEKSTQDLIQNYQKIINQQKGTRNVPPPGVCADYGFLLLKAGKAAEAKVMLQKEIALYPESSIFIGRILKMLEK